MRGIVYASAALIDFDMAALLRLEAHAAARNTGLAITGYLYFEHGRFFQYLEGEYEPVTALMERIGRDPRHRIEHRLFDDDLRARRFPASSMRVLRRDRFAGLDSLVYGHVLFMKQARLATSPVIWQLIEDVAATAGVFRNVDRA